MTDEARKALADECWRDLIEKDDRNSPEEYPEMALISKEELAEYLARSQSGTLAREEVAVFLLNRDEGGDCLDWATKFFHNAKIEKHEGDCRLAEKPAPFTCSRCVADGLLRDADAILALTPSHEAGTQEPVAWTNKAQLGFLKDPSCSGIPMAMWGEPNERAHSVPLYAAPQPASVAQDATREILELAQRFRLFGESAYRPDVFGADDKVSGPVVTQADCFAIATALASPARADRAVTADDQTLWQPIETAPRDGTAIILTDSRVKDRISLPVNGWKLEARRFDDGIEIAIVTDDKPPATHYVRLGSIGSAALRDYLVCAVAPANQTK